VPLSEAIFTAGLSIDAQYMNWSANIISHLCSNVLSAINHIGEVST